MVWSGDTDSRNSLIQAWRKLDVSCRVKKREAASRLSSDSGAGLHPLECLGLFKCSASSIAKVDQRVENP